MFASQIIKNAYNKETRALGKSETLDYDLDAEKRTSIKIQYNDNLPHLYRANFTIDYSQYKNEQIKQAYSYKDQSYQAIEQFFKKNKNRFSSIKKQYTQLHPDKTPLNSKLRKCKRKYEQQTQTEHQVMFKYIKK